MFCRSYDLHKGWAMACSLRKAREVANPPAVPRMRLLARHLSLRTFLTSLRQGSWQFTEPRVGGLRFLEAHC